MNLIVNLWLIYHQVQLVSEVDIIFATHLEMWLGVLDDNAMPGTGEGST